MKKKQPYFSILTTVVITLLGVAVGPIHAMDRDLSTVYSSAKGFAITAEPSGLEGSFKNPATIDIDALTWASSYSDYFAGDVQTINLGLGFRLFRDVSIAIQFPTQLVTDIPQSITNENGNGTIIDSFGTIESEVVLSLSTPLSNMWSIGGTIRYYYADLHTGSGQGAAVDAGILMQLKHVNLGLAVHNIGKRRIRWDNGREEVHNEQFHIGSRINMPFLGHLLIDTTMEKNRSSISNIGIHTPLFHTFSLYAGLRRAISDPQLHLGASLTTGGFNVHYTYSNHEYLGIIHKVGITLEVQ